MHLFMHLSLRESVHAAALFFSLYMHCKSDKVAKFGNKKSRKLTT